MSKTKRLGEAMETLRWIHQELDIRFDDLEKENRELNEELISKVTEIEELNRTIVEQNIEIDKLKKRLANEKTDRWNDLNERQKQLESLFRSTSDHISL